MTGYGKGRFGRWGQLGSAYNNSLTLMEKIKLLKEMIEDLYENETELNQKLDDLMKWIEEDGFNHHISEKLDEMLADGSFDEIINETIFSQLNSELDDLQRFNPVLYGADRTGVLSSDEALTKIILEAKDGDKIIFPKGVYRFEKPLSYTKNLDIDFNGSELYFSSRDGILATGTLKFTQTLSEGYTVGMRNTLVMNDSSGVEVGDIIQIRSTELYSPTRSYYHKGGVFKVTRINGNNIAFDGQMPLAMTGGTITVNVYKPITTTIKNIGLIKNNGLLSNTLYGIRVTHGINCLIEDVKVDNWKRNIEYFWVVQSQMNRINTGHAKAVADTHDGYGISLSSVTNVTLNNVFTNSGQHGVTTGGEEPSYGVVINNSVLKAETWNLGIGMHENIYNVELNDCTLYGFLIAGVCTMNSCRVVIGDRDQDNQSRMVMSQNKNLSRYTFNQCEIEPVITIMETGQILVADVNKIDYIVFNDCPQVKLNVQVKNRSTINKVLEVSDLIIRSSKFVEMQLFDKFKNITIADCNIVASSQPTINQVAWDGTYEKIDNLIISNTHIGVRSKDLNINLAGNVTLDNVTISSSVFGTLGSWFFNNVDLLMMTNVDMSNSIMEYGLESLTGVKILNVFGGKIRFRNEGNKGIQLNQLERLNITGSWNVSTGVLENYIKTPSGSVYKLTYNDTGDVVKTLVS